MAALRTRTASTALLILNLLGASACASRVNDRGMRGVLTPAASPRGVTTATSELRDSLAQRVATLELRRATLLSGYTEAVPAARTLSAEIDALTAEIAQLSPEDRRQANTAIVAALHARRAAVRSEIVERRATLARDTPTVSRLLEEETVLQQRVRQLERHDSDLDRID